MLHFIPWKKLKYKLHLFPQNLGNKSGVELMCRTCQSRIKKNPLFIVEIHLATQS